MSSSSVNFEKSRTQFLVDFVEVILRSDGIGLNGWRVRLPICRTNFSVFVDELEGLHQAKRLFDRTSDRKVVDGHLAKDTLKIGNKNIFIEQNLSKEQTKLGSVEVDLSVINQHYIVSPFRISNDIDLSCRILEM